MAVKQYVGWSGLAHLLGVSESRARQINPLPDATVDGRPAWLPSTAEKIKRDRESRRGQRRAESEAAA